MRKSLLKKPAPTVPRSVRWPTEIYSQLEEVTGQYFAFFCRYALIKFSLEQGWLSAEGLSLLPWVVSYVNGDGEELEDFQLSPTAEAAENLAAEELGEGATVLRVKQGWD